MKKALVTLIIVFGLMAAVNAQDYRTGIGLRGGFTNGITIKHFTGEQTAFEFLLGSRWRGIDITGLYEIHNRAFDADGLKWFYGAGAHVGFWNGDYTYRDWGYAGTNYTVVGLDGILGLEYSFKEVPINLSLDWKPAFNFVGYTGFWADGGALSIRFIF